MAENYYTPGVCNINPKEVAYRRKFGIGLGVAGIVGLVLALLVKAPALLGLPLFLLYWLSAISFLQAKNHFCVSYAASGQYNKSADYADVAQATADQHAIDKAKARTMNIQAVLIGAVSTALACLLLAVV